MNFHKPYTQERVRFSGDGEKDVFFFKFQISSDGQQFESMISFPPPRAVKRLTSDFSL